jgi:hypothetical protein
VERRHARTIARAPDGSAPAAEGDGRQRRRAAPGCGLVDAGAAGGQQQREGFGLRAGELARGGVDLARAARDELGATEEIAEHLGWGRVAVDPEELPLTERDEDELHADAWPPSRYDDPDGPRAEVD